MRAHTWAPMARETSSESLGSTHQSSCQRPPYPRVRGCAPRRRRLGRHLGGALRQHGLGRRLGGALRQHHLSTTWVGASVRRACPCAAWGGAVGRGCAALAPPGAAPLRRAASALLLLFPGFWWAVRDDEVADPPDARPGRRGTEVGVRSARGQMTVHRQW